LPFPASVQGRRIVNLSQRNVPRERTEDHLDADNKVRTRYDDFFGKDFMPLIRHEQTQGAEERLAYATEFAAFQLGQIDKKLGRLIELMEKQEPQPHAKEP
jgi:hypothetical protein